MESFDDNKSKNYGALVNTSEPTFPIVRPQFSRTSSVVSNVSKDTDTEPLLDNGENSSETEKSTKLIRGKTDLLVLISMAMIYFVGVSAFSIISPFFAPEAKLKGSNGTITGLIFAVYPFLLFIFSPIVGKLIPVFGPKYCLVIGCFIEGASEILFGFTSEMESGSVFIVFCFLIRGVTALGSACSQTAILSIVSMTFRENLSTMFGLLELFSGLGFMAGPALGGWLFHLGGFRLPFIVLGSAVLIVWLLVLFILPGDDHYRSTEDGSRESKPGSIKEVLSIPGILALSSVAICGGMVLSFLDPTLTNHLNSVTAPDTLSSEKVGLIFLIPAVFYALSAPITGALTDKCLNKRYTILVGHLMVVACYLFLGPSPLIKSFVPRKLLIVCIAFGALGIGISLFLVPVLADMTETAKKAGQPDNLATTAVISGIFNSVFSIGEMLGPTLGGFLTDKLTFEWASTIFAFVLAALFLSLLVFTLWEKNSKWSGKGKRISGYVPIVDA